MYTIQRYLDPDGLTERGIDHFDAWAATFGEVVEKMEISPDGRSLRPRSRFAKFVNLPELQQMFRSYADVQTAAMLNLPRPRLKGAKPTEIATIGDADTDAKKQSLFEKVRNGVVRILIGSTQKMGPGTNVQKLLVASRNLDVPWKPAEVEQRDGRMLRQGNTNEEVENDRYV